MYQVPKPDIYTFARSVCCQNCRKSEDEAGVRMKTCAACDNAHYCSKECQKAHWPEHNTGCRHNQGEAAKYRAAGHAAEELRNKYDSWVKHRKGMVASLTHGVLKEMLGSMVLLIGVEHKPCRTPCFQVCRTGLAVMSLHDLEKDKPAIGGVIREQQREHKQAARGDGKDLVLGHAVMLCTFGTIMETRIVPTLLDRSKDKLHSSFKAEDVDDMLHLMNSNIEEAK